MPRQARIDAPGALHHIFCRGLERKRIFWDDTDRDSFISRLGNVLQKTATRCFAWTLVPNHFHLLLQTGRAPISTVMSSLLTGYVVVFNRRHNRAGHLFQNRYKSILCQAEPYLLELVRYIHLNPIRARLVGSMAELKEYRYCGHRQLVEGGPDSWQATDEILLRFGESKKEAVEKYISFVSEGIAIGRRPDLTGGGLVRSAGGWHTVLAARRGGEFLHSDERILGDSEFVEVVLQASDEMMEKRCLAQRDGLNLDYVAKRAADLLQLSVEEIWHGGKKPLAVKARSLLCLWAIREMGMSAATLATLLGLSASAVIRAAQRGEQIVTETGWELKEV